jgi:methylenetetrahydrofolate dehydrogenase (NADP+)/methenyltetrahydrofolate cyclohydrolase
MSAAIMDGNAAAVALRAKVADEVARLAHERGLVPGLAVVLAGDDAASSIYVRNKVKRSTEAGVRSSDHRFPADVSEEQLLAAIGRLNADPAVHGILVQLPLPRHIDAQKAILAIDPAKDVDGLHPMTVGALASGSPTLVPCTPRACIILAKSVHKTLAGLEAVVVGRSNIVGKPLAHLLLGENATVTIAHSKTRELADVCYRADLLIAAVGRPELVRGSWVKPGATVIDVGINRIADKNGKQRLVGDVAFNEAVAIAGAITPVPGGVGPMTIACVLVNTVLAACAQARVPRPEF